MDKENSGPIKPAVLDWQQSVVTQLTHLKKQQKLPHAILIELKTVIDSRELGWYIAQALLCDNQQQGLACGKCSSCQLMMANNYPDFTFTTLVTDDKTHKLNKVIKINQIRRLIHQLSLTHNREGGKIALIYPAEKLNQAAANSLLKTLEEPSADSIIILLTHNPGKLPITMRSRCQKWVFENPSSEVALPWLEQFMEHDQLDEYLTLSQQDPQQALDLYQKGFKQQFDSFEQTLNQFINGQTEVTTTVKSLKSLENGTVRLLLGTYLQKLIQTITGQRMTKVLQDRLQTLLNLLSFSEKSLQAEDNNLNLLLQLEDVLISLKQIMNAGG